MIFAILAVLFVIAAAVALGFDGWWLKDEKLKADADAKRIRRSEGAKKGWVTRKANAAARATEKGL